MIDNFGRLRYDSATMRTPSALKQFLPFTLYPLPFLLLLSFTALAQPPPPPPPPPQPPGGSILNILEDVKNTKHNLSSSGPGDRRVFTTATSEICVFCHTPHGAAPETIGLGGPLWNRRLSTASYQMYDNTWSFSFEGTMPVNAPTGFSRLCLSCHDGTIALGSVMNAPGSGGYETAIPMVGSPTIGPGETMPLGPGGELTGDTRRLGSGGTVNLRNDHPISFVFDSALVTTKDPELVNPGPSPLRPSQEPLYPAGIGPLRRYAGLVPGQYDSVQCTSCHNPHAVTFPRFLRAPIVDCSNPANPCPGTGLSANSQGQRLVCFFCHDKDRPAGNSYSTSTHAVSQAKHAVYPSLTDSPTNPGYDFDGAHNVGQASCRNCHDPHTAQGAQRLHREGVDTPGGGSSVENTCYLCHSPGPSSGAGIVIQPAPTPSPNERPTLPAGANSGFLIGFGTRIAPDIYTQFAKDHNLSGPTACSNQVNCGSAMNLEHDDAASPRNHQPFFVKRPQEGVEYASVSPPAGENEAAPGLSQPDDITTRHIECVDCHNPHQVTRPTIPGSAGRMKGMKGITHNDRVVGVDVTGLCDPGPSCNREPYIYEVCFRCHGNSVPTLFSGDDNPGSTTFRSNPQPGAQASVPDLSYQGFSNKRLEFSPANSINNLNASNMTSTTADPVRGQYEIGPDAGIGSDPTNGQLRRVGPGLHKSYHPVVAPGRNATRPLFEQLKGAFGLSSQADLTSLTIHCTDCHNNDFYDAYQDGTGFFANLLGPITESTLRATDRVPNASLTVNYTGVTGTRANPPRVSEPIGPHGSDHVRILRAPYNTDIANTGRSFRRNGFDPAQGGIPGPDAPAGNHFNNFLLCFQCHDRAAFDPAYGSQTDPNLTGFFGNAGSAGGNVGAPASIGTPGLWSNNLHMYHLVRTGAYCHECHMNLHSNAQARNTIYGSGSGTIVGVSGSPGYSGNCTAPAAGCVGLPPDLEDGILDGVSDTHLINFAPGGPTGYIGELQPPGPATPVGFDHYANAGVEGVTAPLPVWYFDGSATSGVGDAGRFRCNMRCHGVVMATCHYRAVNSLLDPVNLSVGNEAGGDPTAWCSGGITQESCIQADQTQPGC